MLFWRATTERALKTTAQTLVAVLGVDGIGLLNAPWGAALSAAGMAALLSILSSVASSGQVGDPGSPSLVETVSASSRD
ncbi:holin [Longimycelium tulufanense]|uniref:holin n=1 Tax=Longimycelium tulufanense TaxID=907463 RepID=UPI003570C71A